MTKSRLTSWLCWLLIAAQTGVFVVGHGSVVVCHDENGSSHIEIVDENSCSTQAEDACTLAVATAGETQLSSLCSETECVDEAFGFSGTLSTLRMARHREQQGVQPIPSCAIASWLLPVDLFEVLGCSVDFNDLYALYAFHQSNRSTVLVL